jgi:hypothetical protein
MEPAAAELPTGTLVKLTWDSYDAITLGAFSDWSAAYEAADPVFLLVEGDVDLPFLAPGDTDVEGMSEMKFRSTAWHDTIPQVLASPFLTAFHDQLVDVVWAALVLAVPGAALGWPRTSVTVLLPDEGHVLLPGGSRCEGLRIQGEADQEYVFSADTACTPVTEEQLLHAAALVPVVQRLRGDDRLGPALGQLLATSEPTLSPAERLVIAVSALEGLLLPEVRSGLQDTFATRVAGVLGPWADAPARDLYRARSRAVHDGADAAEARISPGAAEQMLADVLIASQGGPPAPDPATGPPAAAPPDHPMGVRVRGFAPTERLLPRPPWWSATMSTAVDLAPPAGHVLSWSPLVGLTFQGAARPIPGGCTLVDMTAQEIISMEEKDIRRDFIARLTVEDVPVAGLAVVAPHTLGAPLDDPLMADLLGRRDLAVAGLRLAGLAGFTDPELLGWYAYEGSLRHRRETVLRQTVLMRLGSGDHHHLEAQDLARVEPIWTLLDNYAASGRTPTIDAMLGLLRRAHHTTLNPATRATLLFALLESVLGRFRAPTDPVQLEELVHALPRLDPAAAAWFGRSGRSTRNATAHGSWTPAEDAPELAFLQSVCGAALHELLVVWTTRDVRPKNPGKLLAAHLTGATT